MKCVNNTTANTLKKIFTKSTKSIYIYKTDFKTYYACNIFNKNIMLMVIELVMVVFVIIQSYVVVHFLSMEHFDYYLANEVPMKHV